MPLSREEILELPEMLWHEYAFEPSDALAAMVSPGQEHDSRLQEVVEQNNVSRIYPVDGGHIYKFLFRQGDRYDPAFFSIEKGAWDHEHCDVCGETISTGDHLWVTVEPPYVLLCPTCYKELLQPRKPWWKFW